MPIASEIKGDIKAARKVRLPWWGLLCVGIGAYLTSWLFDHLGRFDLVLPILNAFFVLGFAVAVKWKLRRRSWFWITMTILAVFHVPLILLVPWTTKWIPAIAIALIDSADLVLMLAILAIVGNFTRDRHQGDDPHQV